MEKYKWKYNQASAFVDFQNHTIDKDILRILLNRDLNTKEKVEHFLNPDLNNIFDPYLFEDVGKSVKRIRKAIEEKEEIYIYGDYDVDGVTSTSLFVLAMKHIGYPVKYHIPKREDGYGINKDALKTLAASGCKLMITVDCGISSNEEISYGNSLGIDTIITDHHEITGLLPEAFSIVNPKRIENLYSFKSLAGVGTAFILLYALYESYNRGEEIFRFLDIVAIGTVADIVPLIEENRIFVKHGLEMLRTPTNKGLSILVNKLFENPSSHIFTSYDIGFRIAPVFNAAGRLDDAKTAVRLLVEDNIRELTDIAEYLISKNTERQGIEKDIIKNIEKSILDQNLSSNGIIIAADSSFHHGVIGIAASKITDKYYKPTIIMEIKDNGTAVGSARSIEGFNIIKAISSMKELFVKYGGHEGAAGFTLPIENLPIFKERMMKEASATLDSDDYIRPVYIDTELNVFKISLEFYYLLSKLAPFGYGNPNPIFSISNVYIVNIRLIGKTQEHLMFDIIQNDTCIKNCAWFGKAEYFQYLNEGNLFNVAFKLDLNYFNDRYSAKILVESVTSVETAENVMLTGEYYFDLYNTIFPIDTVFYSKNPNFDKTGIFTLDFESSNSYVSIKQGSKTISQLTNELSFVLRFLKDNYNYRFNLSLLSAERTSSNFTVRGQITRDFEFRTLSFNAPSIFKDIKEFLLGKFEYNQLQRNVLKSIFHEKNDTLLISRKGRGVKTIILTIGIYLWNKSGHKSLLVCDTPISDPLINYYFDVISESDIGNISKYPFAAFYNSIPSKRNPNINFVFSEEDTDYNGFEKILDDILIPDTLNIIDYDEILHHHKRDNFYHPFLPLEEKLRYLGKVQNKENITATRDILALL